MSDKINVLVTCMGGYGALNLVQDFQRSSLADRVRFVGTHMDPYFLARSDIDTLYKVPGALADPEKYLDVTRRIIEKEKIDVLIPKSDAEVKAVSAHRDTLNCCTFLPAHEEIEIAQDKFSFYEVLRDAGIPAAETYCLESFDDIGPTLDKLPDAKRHWVRIKTAGEAGAFGASWVESQRQAEDWIRLWVEMRGIDIREFTISEYLPGRLFECFTIFKDGTLRLAKVYENVRFNPGTSIGVGIGSTPGLARTIDDEEARAALNTSIQEVEAAGAKVGSKPNGVYHLSAKHNEKGEPCITEVNIGRPPSTVGFFSRTGKTNAAELFLYYAAGVEIADPDPVFDLQSDPVYMIRSLDRELTLCTQADIDGLQEI